jgi:hypothetical protein
MKTRIPPENLQNLQNRLPGSVACGMNVQGRVLSRGKYTVEVETHHNRSSGDQPSAYLRTRETWAQQERRAYWNPAPTLR